MSRPKKLEEPEKGPVEEKVARILAQSCGIQGCSAKNHLEEARKIIAVTKGEN